MKNKMYLNVSLTFLFACLMASTSFAQLTTNDGNIYLRGQSLYGDNATALYFDSNNSTRTQLILRDKENTQYGRVYGSGNGLNFGLLDGDGQWSYLAQKDVYTAFRINNSEKMRILANGNIGIGTNAPTTKLHVKGTVRATNWNNLDQYIEMSHGGANSYINHVGAGRMDFRFEGSNRMVLTPDGKLGIGTDTPTGSLHVNGTVNPTIKIGNGTSTLEIGSATCNGCFSSVAVVNDKVIKLSGSQNLIFSTGAAVGAGRSFNFVTGSSSHLKIRETGKVSVGNVPTPGDYKLYVEQGILTEKVKVDNVGDWADFVFEEDYDLNSLEEVEQFTKENKHLPNVPSAEDVSKNGIDMAEMDATLLRQIEELWLHVIEMKKENEALKTEVKTLLNK